MSTPTRTASTVFLFIPTDIYELSAPLLSNEMTDQVNSGASDPILSFTLVVCVQLFSSFCSAELFSLSGEMGCDAVFALPANLGTPTALRSVPIDDVSLGARTSQSPHVSHCTSGCWYHVQHWIGSRIQQQSQQFMDMVTSRLCGTRALRSSPE